MNIKTKLLKSPLIKLFICGVVFGFIVSLLYLLFYFIVSGTKTSFVGESLYNSLGAFVFPFPGSLFIINNFGITSFLSYAIFFAINVLLYGLAGIIIGIFSDKVDKKTFLILFVIFLLFFASAFFYATTLMQIGAGGPTSLKTLPDPKNECLAEGGQWTSCDNIKNVPGTCKTISKVNEAYKKYPSEGCDCGNNKYWAVSYNTCWRYESKTKPNQLAMVAVSVFLNLILLFIASFGIRYLKKGK